MSEQISTLSDGELTEENFSRELQSLLGNKKFQQAWRDYQMIGDAMRGTPALSEDFTARLMEKLEQEPTVLAPSALPRAKQQSATHKKAKLPVAWSMAASCAAVLLVGWAMVNQHWQADPQAALQLAVSQEVNAPINTSANVVQTQVSLENPNLNEDDTQSTKIVKTSDQSLVAPANQVVNNTAGGADADEASIAPLEYLAAHHASAPSVGSYYLQNASFSE
jgi:sigma-E factor negative regulatory protein RseA